MVVQTLTDAEMREIMNRISNFYITKANNVHTPFMDKFKAAHFTDKDYKFLLNYSVLLERGNPQTRGEILENLLRKRRLGTNEQTNRTASPRSRKSARKSLRGRSRNGRGSQRSRSSAKKSRNRHV
jgi:ADP-ribosylglycohydrolase